MPTPASKLPPPYNLRRHTAEYCTVQQVAGHYQVSPDTISRLIAKGALSVARIGRTVRIATRDALQLGRPDQ